MNDAIPFQFGDVINDRQYSEHMRYEVKRLLFKNNEALKNLVCSYLFESSVSIVVKNCLLNRNIPAGLKYIHHHARHLGIMLVVQMWNRKVDDEDLARLIAPEFRANADFIMIAPTIKELALKSIQNHYFERTGCTFVLTQETRKEHLRGITIVTDLRWNNNYWIVI